MRKRLSDAGIVLVMATNLPDQLAVITHSSEEVFEDAMLHIYQALITELCARAAAGLNRAIVTPNIDAGGPNATSVYPRPMVARAMVKLLNAEGMTANLVGGSPAQVQVRWSAFPKHWNDSN